MASNPAISYASQPLDNGHTLLSGEGPGEHLIRSTRNFVVYLDKELELEWQTTDEFEDKFNVGDSAQVLRRIAYLNAVPTSHLPKEHVKSLRLMLGEAMALALQDQIIDAGHLANDAFEFLIARNRDCSRRWFLLASLISFGVIALICLLTYSLRTALDGTLGAEIIDGVCCAGIAACGSMCSIILRIPKLQLDPAAGTLLHSLEAIGRLILGSIFGVAALIAIKSELIFPKLNGAGLAGMLVIAFASGFSERLVPSFIQYLERNTVQLPPGTPGELPARGGSI